jgi:hypothetical protein
MSGVIKEGYCFAPYGLPEFPDNIFEPGSVQIGLSLASHQFEPEALERISHNDSIIDRICKRSHMLISGITNYQRHAVSS